MKSLFFTLSLFALGISMSAQSPCEAADSIEALYYFDAQVLAVRQMQDDPNLQGEIKILPQLIDLYLRPMVAVYQAFGMPARDTVVQCLNIHTFPQYDLKSIVAGVDTTTPWVQKFIANTFPTGNNDADLLISNYQLTSSGFLPALGILTVQSPAELNMPALAAKFATLPGIVYAEPNWSAGDGNDISINTAPLSFWQASYTHGWGDCPAGCIQNRTWVFNINSMTCTVSFANSFGNLVDIPCETTNGTADPDYLEKFEANPTVTTGFLRVKILSNRAGEGMLKLVATNGKIALQSTLKLQPRLEQVIELDVEALPAGIYFLSLAIDNQVFTKKIVRQRL